MRLEKNGKQEHNIQISSNGAYSNCFSASCQLLKSGLNSLAGNIDVDKNNKISYF
jgi:hypothetical protein